MFRGKKWESFQKTVSQLITIKEKEHSDVPYYRCLIQKFPNPIDRLPWKICGEKGISFNKFIRNIFNSPEIIENNWYDYAGCDCKNPIQCVHPLYDDLLNSCGMIPDAFFYDEKDFTIHALEIEESNPIDEIKASKYGQLGWSLTENTQWSLSLLQYDVPSGVLFLTDTSQIELSHHLFGKMTHKGEFTYCTGGYRRALNYVREPIEIRNRKVWAIGKNVFDNITKPITT